MGKRIALAAGQSLTVVRAPQGRLCDWCHDRPVERRGAKYCSHSCRQRAYEFRRQVEQLIADAQEANRHVREAIDRLRAGLARQHVISPRTQQEAP